MLRVVASIAAVLVATTSCSDNADSATEFLELMDQSKQSLRAYVSPSPDTTVLLLFDPVKCLACGAPVGPWKDWSGSSPTRTMRLFLTRSPSKTEEASLRVARLKVDGILRDKWLGTRMPIVVLIAGALVIDSAAGQQGAAQLVGTWVLGGNPPPVLPHTTEGTKAPTKGAKAASNWALAR